MLFLIIIFFLIILFYFLRNPTELLQPYNLLIENIHEKKVFYTDDEKKQIFPTSIILENNWKQIRRECISCLPHVEELDNIGKNYIVEKDEFWQGWKTFEFRMFGKDNLGNMQKCPTLANILKSDANITSAFFSIMQSGKTLSSHYGPFKGILRYHLGLICPPRESGPCFISVDGQTYDWKDGEGVLFDETYKHFVHNKTPYDRVILFLDVKRPMKTYTLTLLNDLILYGMGISPYN